MSTFAQPTKPVTPLRPLVQIIASLAVVGGIAGCAAPQPYQYSSGTSPQVNSLSSNSTVSHIYSVTASDSSGKPLSGVSVKVNITSDESSTQTQNCITNDAGKCLSIIYEVGRDHNMTYVKSYKSRAMAEAVKNGYSSVKKGGYSTFGSEVEPSSQFVYIDLKMIKPTDYLSDDFLSSARDKDLRDRVLRFIDTIRLESVLGDADVMFKGIGTIEFKGKKYLQVKVNSTTQFNNLKLNKYDIGKRLFDDTVRKMLNPLNSAIAAPKAYYGYDIVVYGYSKSFADKYATPDKHEFRFLMPESVVRRYKGKEISGQALLDASVILLNDERIDMKLQ